MRRVLWLAVMMSATAVVEPTAPVSHARASLPLARRPVSGAAGPFAQVTVTLRRASAQPHAPFAGTVRLPNGRMLPLAGPDEPADLFLVDVTAVLFTPIDRSRRNGIVILYNSSQIGPGNGTDRLALVYRLTPQAAVRQPAIEQRLEGAESGAQVRRILGGNPTMTLFYPQILAASTTDSARAAAVTAALAMRPRCRRSRAPARSSSTPARSCVRSHAA